MNSNNHFFNYPNNKDQHSSASRTILWTDINYLNSLQIYVLCSIFERKFKWMGKYKKRNHNNLFPEVLNNETKTFSLSRNKERNFVKSMQSNKNLYSPKNQ